MTSISWLNDECAKMKKKNERSVQKKTRGQTGPSAPRLNTKKPPQKKFAQDKKYSLKQQGQGKEKASAKIKVEPTSQMLTNMTGKQGKVPKANTTSDDSQYEGEPLIAPEASDS